MVHSLHTQGTTRRATDGVGRRACPRAARNRPATVRVHPPVCAAPRHSSRAQRFDPPHPPQPPPAAGCATTPSARHPRAAVRPGWARWRSSQRRALCARTRGRRRPRRPLGATPPFRVRRAVPRGRAVTAEPVWWAVNLSTPVDRRHADPLAWVGFAVVPVSFWSRPCGQLAPAGPHSTHTEPL